MKPVRFYGVQAFFIFNQILNQVALFIMEQIFLGIANNIWVLIPLVAIIGGIGSGMFSSHNDNKKLKEENEYLKHLLAQKDQQLLQNQELRQRLDFIERRLTDGK